jgi:hypothetical protein
MKISVIITGSTGMVGEGVLNECLHHPQVEKVLIINRKPGGFDHPKLSEIIHGDFHNLTPIESQLGGYNACFFCLGISSVGMSETDYHHTTHDLTLNFARTLLKHNKDLTFCYVSGAGTDSTEKGRSMWARVKGKTENSLIRMPFKRAFAFRPGFMEPTKGLKNTLKLYKYFSWLTPLLRLVAPSYICTLREVGRAMINATIVGYEKPVLEVRDIVVLANRSLE